MKRRLTIAAAVSAVALAVAGAAQAHVTVHPNVLPSGGFTVIDVRVPNERPTASTVRVDVQLPSGFIFLSYQPMPGWSTKVIYRKLAKPVTVFGEKFTREVDRVVWSSRGSRIQPGEFVEFPLSVAMPSGKKGSLLTFKALQTYSNGEIVRWIGSPSADEPAPQVMLAGADDSIADYPAGVSVAKKRQTSSLHPALGFVIGIPLLGVAGVAVLRWRRRAR
jgi:uncharacterized protein YcnI